MNDPSKWRRLEKYVTDMLTAFRDDDRILVWDLYNEPGNPKRGCESLPLLQELFKWARTVNPSQPLTASTVRSRDWRDLIRSIQRFRVIWNSQFSKSLPGRH